MTKRQVSEMFGGGMEIGSLHTLCPAVSQAPSNLVSDKHCVASTIFFLTSVNTFSQTASANMANSLSLSQSLSLSHTHTNIEYI